MERVITSYRDTEHAKKMEASLGMTRMISIWHGTTDGRLDWQSFMFLQYFFKSLWYLLASIFTHFQKSFWGPNLFKDIKDYQDLGISPKPAPVSGLPEGNFGQICSWLISKLGAAHVAQVKITILGSFEC